MVLSQKKGGVPCLGQGQAAACGGLKYLGVLFTSEGSGRLKDRLYWSAVINKKLSIKSKSSIYWLVYVSTHRMRLLIQAAKISFL